MRKQLFFNEIIYHQALEPLKAKWRETLTAPQDGMWETITDSSKHLEIRLDNQLIGYACIDHDNRLLQFFVQPEQLQEGPHILEQLIDQKQIKSALVGTNNPVFQSLAISFQQSMVIDTYLFSDLIKSEVIHPFGQLKLAWEADLNGLVDFYHDTIGAPVAWLNNYLLNLISRGELFYLTDGTEVLGTCEVRLSDSDHRFADIGMVVGLNHRKKGLGTYLLGKAKELSYDSGRTPICSCEAGNIGSLKAIHKNGFRSIHQMLKLSF